MRGEFTVVRKLDNNEDVKAWFKSMDVSPIQETELVGCHVEAEGEEISFDDAGRIDLGEVPERIKVAQWIGNRLFISLFDCFLGESDRIYVNGDELG